MPRQKSEKRKREEFEEFLVYMESWRGAGKMSAIRAAGDVDAAIRVAEGRGWTHTAELAREWVRTGGTAPMREAASSAAGGADRDMVGEWLESLDRRLAALERGLGIGE